MTSSKQSQTAKQELDVLLETTEFVRVPEQFTERVMAAISDLPDAPDDAIAAANPWWQWLALGMSLTGVIELGAFILSVWTVASAG